MRDRRLIWVLLPMILISCLGGKKNDIETKEKTMTFNLENGTYPVEYANYQRNSYVRAEVKSEWRTVWSKEFAMADPEIVISPRAVLVNGQVVAAKTASEVFVFDSSGALKFVEASNTPTPVVLGAEAMAYFNDTGGLVYQGYDQVRLCDEEPVPGFDQWAYALLMRPTKEEVLGVVQNAGVRGQDNKIAHIFRFVRESLSSVWSYEVPGRIDHALLSIDEKSLLTVTGETVQSYDTESGEAGPEFKTGIVDPWSVSIGLDGGLVMIGRKEDTQGAKRFCSAFSPDGEEKWSLQMIDPTMMQPPAHGEDGNVYLIDNHCLKCINDGKTVWSTPPYFGEKPCITVTSGNRLLVLNGATLYLFDPAGEKLFETIISKDGDIFGIPPAVDASGAIYVMSNRKLYCLE